MAERDGTIVIDTQIDTKGVDAGSEKTEASLRRMAQKVNDIGATAKAALNKQIDAFARLNSQYDSQSEKIDALKRKIAGYSDEYGEMQAKIDETVKKLNDLEMMQGVIKDAVKDSAKRGTTFDTTQYKWVQEDIEKLTGFSSVGFNVGYWSAPMVPYLAQGAVIPPNKEFMAVLGDQKSGNNIEAPESLIRRIVREESGNGKGSTYNVTAQVNRRTLFDLVLEEGKVRRTVTGRNPFETV